MPCRDSWDEPCSCHITIKKHKDRADELAQMLCYLCGSLANVGKLKNHASEDILAWWEQHEKADTERVRSKLKQMIESGQSPGSAARDLINEALAVHPVSDYHKRWFHELASREHEEVLRRQAKIAKQSEARARAIAKLTDDERKLLGIKDGGRDDAR